MSSAVRDAKALVSDLLGSVDALEVALGCGSLCCLWVLYHMARNVVMHILTGLLFMGTAAWAFVNGQLAKRPQQKMGWFVMTGGAIFLFLYWALNVVFRAPVIKEGIGCGGVQFIHDEL